MKRYRLIVLGRDVIQNWVGYLCARWVSTMATRNHSVYWAFAQFVRRLDPRIVRLHDPVSFPKRMFSFALIGIALVVGVAVLTSLIKDAAATQREDLQPTEIVEPPHLVVQYHAIPVGVKPSVAAPAAKESVAKASGPERINTSAKVPPHLRARHPRFYDPILIFTEQAPHQVSAYPLANPPGVVVDIKGLSVPFGSARQAVGADDRVAAVRARATEAGVRYIVTLTIPISRIETEFEGRVIMVYPTL